MTRWNNQLKTIVLLGGLSALLVGIAGALAPGRLPLVLVLVLAAGMNLAAYFFSDRLVLRMHGARELAEGEAPALRQTLRELALRAEIPPPRLFLIDDPSPNAFATGRSSRTGVVAVTRGLLERLPPVEVRAVLAHELAHIRHHDVLVSTIAACLAGAVTWAAHVVGFGGGARDEDDGPSPLATLALVLVAPLAATLIQLGVSRSRELLADEAGARIAGDPLALARALQRLEAAADAVPLAGAQPATASLFIVSPLAGGAILPRLFSTHPATEERVKRLRALAGYRRAA